MKIENLHEGQIFKNYNDLCATLEIKAKRGNSKNAQIKEMNTLFSHHKEGNKIVIDEISENLLNTFTFSPTLECLATTMLTSLVLWVFPYAPLLWLICALLTRPSKASGQI